MDKLSIALNPTNQALSSADYKGSSENYYNPVKLMADICENAFLEKEKKREESRIAEKEERKKAIKQCFEWGRKKAENLKIAYAILSNDKDRIELAPHLDIKAFLEVVNDNFDYKERWLLADLIYKMFDKLDDQINKIQSCNDIELYYQYYTYNPKAESNHVTADHNGKPVYRYGMDEPTAEMVEMETERDLLMKLSSELDYIITFEPEPEDLEELKEALAA